MWKYKYKRRERWERILKNHKNSLFTDKTKNRSKITLTEKKENTHEGRDTYSI